MAPYSLVSVDPIYNGMSIPASKMGATPIYLAIILARANAYSHVSAKLRLDGTVVIATAGFWI